MGGRKATSGGERHVPGNTLPTCIGPRVKCGHRCTTMNVVVCVKQIPDPADPGALDPSTNTLKRDGKLILDESDSYGVEMALQLVDAAGGGEVSLVSMAPNGEDERPAHRARHGCGQGRPRQRPASPAPTPSAPPRSSPRPSSASACRPRLAATESSDGYTGTVPEQVAELLGLPSVTFAKKVEIADGTVKVQRQTEAGYDEVECPLPGVVSVTAGVVEPRYPSFKGIMAAKSKPVDRSPLADLGSTASVGWAGAGQEIVERHAAAEARGRRDHRGRRRGFAKIVAFLENLKVI
jgi:electron transfer flavoprotein beta subunit